MGRKGALDVEMNNIRNSGSQKTGAHHQISCRSMLGGCQTKNGIPGKAWYNEAFQK